MAIKLSVLISIYNQAEFVPEMLASIEAQSFRDFEVIVVNDGSTDETGLILNDMQYPWLKVIHQKNCGKCSGFNRAFEVSRGSYLCLFAGDDVYLPDAFQDKVSFIEVLQLDFVMSKLQLLALGSPLDGLVVPKRKGRGNKSGGSLIFSRSFAEKAFPIPLELPNEDQWLHLIANELNFRIGESGTITYLLRLHESNDFSRDMDFNSFSKKIAARNEVYRIFLERFGEELEQTQFAALESAYKLDVLRQQGAFFRILCMKSGFRQKVWAIMHLNSFLYALKKRLRPILIGL